MKLHPQYITDDAIITGLDLEPTEDNKLYAAAKNIDEAFHDAEEVFKRIEEQRNKCR